MLIDRGFRPPDFEDRIMKGLEVIDGEAVLIHLGDVCMGNDKEEHEKFLSSFSHERVQTTVLVKGNHDRKSESWFYDAGWDFVCDSFTIRRYGQSTLFTHRPVAYSLWKGLVSKNIHGHTHANNHRNQEVSHFYREGFNIELALETHDYKPWLFDDQLLGLVPLPRTLLADT